MDQISEMDDELCPEYDFIKLTVVARGQGRKKADLSEQLNPKDISDGWTEQDRSDITDFSLHYTDSLF
jgi:hypothetical protein